MLWFINPRNKLNDKLAWDFMNINIKICLIFLSCLWQLAKLSSNIWDSHKMKIWSKTIIIRCTSRDSLPTLRVRFSNFNFVLELKCRNLSTDHAVPCTHSGKHRANSLMILALGNWNPLLVSYVETVAKAWQNHLRCERQVHLSFVC